MLKITCYTDLKWEVLTRGTDEPHVCWGSQAVIGVFTPRGVPHAAGGAADEGAWLPVFTPHPPIDVNSKSGM